MPTNGRIRRTILTWFLTYSIAASAFAGSRETPESTAVGRLAQAFTLFELTHDGASPKNWNDLSGVCDIESMNRNLAPRGTAPIQDRYEFISQELYYEINGLEKPCRVLMIRTVPLSVKEGSNGARLKRYIIFEYPDGTTGSARLPEETVQEMLKKANLTISPKVGLPVVESEEFLPGMDPNANPNGKVIPNPATATTGTAPHVSTDASTSEATTPAKTSPGAVTSENSDQGIPGAWLVGGVVAVGILVLLGLGYRMLKK